MVMLGPGGNRSQAHRTITHPLADGKKRTLWALLVTFLAVNDLKIIAGTEEACGFLLSVATDSLETSEISVWLRQRIHPL